MPEYRTICQTSDEFQNEKHTGIWHPTTPSTGYDITPIILHNTTDEDDPTIVSDLQTVNTTTDNPTTIVEHDDLSSINTIVNDNNNQLPNTLVCAEKQQDLHTLLQHIIPIFKDYITNHPHEEYSTLLKEWFDKGLSDKVSFEDLTNITNISHLEEFYLLLMISPPIKTKLLLQWEQQYIVYSVLHNTSDSLKPHSQIIKVENYHNLEHLLTLVHPILQDWINTANNHHTIIILHHAIAHGLSNTSTWIQIKQSLNISTYQDYYYCIHRCPLLGNHIQIIWDAHQKTLSYHITKPYQNINQNLNPIVSTTNTPIKSNKLPSIPTLNVDTPPPATHGKHVDWETYSPDDNFQYIHSITPSIPNGYEPNTLA
jgi:hypothetical protein